MPGKNIHIFRKTVKYAVIPKSYMPKTYLEHLFRGRLVLENVFSKLWLQTPICWQFMLLGKFSLIKIACLLLKKIFQSHLELCWRLFPLCFQQVCVSGGSRGLYTNLF